jgi:hypothetical protein
MSPSGPVHRLSYDSFYVYTARDISSPLLDFIKYFSGYTNPNRYELGFTAWTAANVF